MGYLSTATSFSTIEGSLPGGRRIRFRATSFPFHLPLCTSAKLSRSTTSPKSRLSMSTSKSVLLCILYNVYYYITCINDDIPSPSTRLLSRPMFTKRQHHRINTCCPSSGSVTLTSYFKVVALIFNCTPIRSG